MDTARSGLGGPEKKKVVRFEHEEELELLLSAFRKHTAIPVGKA